MGFFNDFIRGATPAIEGGTNIGLRGMAEAQRKKELQDEIQRQTQQQAFVNMMKQQEMEYGQQRDAIGDQRYAQEYQDNKYFQQQQGVDDLSRIMLQGQNQLQQNQFEQERINIAKQSAAQGGGGNPNAAAVFQEYQQIKMQNPDDPRLPDYEQFLFNAKIGQPKVDPMARLEYADKFATDTYGADYMKFKDQPGALDSLRGVGQQRYDANMGGGGEVSAEEAAAATQALQNVNDLIAQIKAKHGLK